jgi:L-alanine-DL-glutamate epimerase-like enolase superfamily enzyme
MVTFQFHIAFLRFRYPFRIAHGERLGTDVVFIVASIDGVKGYGEATLPPYLGIQTSDVMEALQRRGVERAFNEAEPDCWFNALNQIIPDCMPALAALDMARWQIHAKNRGQSVGDILGKNPNNSEVPHTFTLGVSDKSEMAEKVKFASSAGYTLFKLKLNGKDDWDMLHAFRSLSVAPFAIDANQAWKEPEQALAYIDFLEKEGCVLIEQPFHKSDRLSTLKLRKHTEIPVIADEACQQLSDVREVLEAFDGVNVKLQKCGGITPAIRQIQATRAAGKKALIGCMSESSVGCNAAEQLAYLCHWADLDGPVLNVNNELLCEEIGYSL